MNLLSLISTLSIGLVAGYGLHAWAPWADVDRLEKPPAVLVVHERPAAVSAGHERPVTALVGLDYDKIMSDWEFATEAMTFLDGLDDNCPQTSTERVIAIVMAQDRYGLPPLAGFQIASYADRYSDALGLLTAHRLREAPAIHRERYEKVRKALSLLNEREGDYCGYVFGGTGAYRDRRVEHMQVEEFMSGWALRLVKSPAATNPDPRKSFSGLIGRLEADHQTLEKALKSDILREYRLEEGAKCRRKIMEAFVPLMEELKAWPPEVSDGLAPLILLSFR